MQKPSRVSYQSVYVNYLFYFILDRVALYSASVLLVCLYWLRRYPAAGVGAARRLDCQIVNDSSLITNAEYAQQNRRQ